MNYPNKIYIKITSQKLNNFNLFCEKIKFLFNEFKISVIKLPKKKKKLTILKSPHVNKTAREQFESRTNRYLITIFNTTNNNISQKELLQIINQNITENTSINITYNGYTL